MLAVLLLGATGSAGTGGPHPAPTGPRPSPLAAGVAGPPAPWHPGSPLAPGGAASTGGAPPATNAARAAAGGRTPSPWNATGWTELGIGPLTEIAGNPAQRFVYDPSLHGDLYFGGWTNYGVPDNQTWLFNSSGWHSLSPRQSPPRITAESMAWDAVDAEMVLFGGTPDGEHSLNATWAFANGTWTNLSEPYAPPPTSSAAMFSDPDNGSVVLFGGFVTPTPTSAYDSNATWVFVGGHWHALKETRAPSPRLNAAASWDSSADEGIVFGGDVFSVESGTTYYNDTWAFAGGAWSPLSPPTNATARSSASLSDDPALGGVVLFGGALASGAWANDTWVFATGRWAAFVSSPAAPPKAEGSPMGLTTAPDGTSLALFLITTTLTSSAYETQAWDLSTLQPTILATPPTDEGDRPVELSVSVLGTTVPQNFSWQFGDGTTGNGSTLPHVFPAPGAYRVTVTVSDRNGRVANTTRTIWSYPPLVLTADVTPPVGVAPLTVRFTGTVSGGEPPYAQTWSSPALVGLNGTAGSAVIPQPGTYWLTDTGADAGNYTVVRAFLVTVLAPSGLVPLSASIVANVSNGTAPLAVLLVGLASGGTAPYAFGWRFSDDLTAGGGTVTRTFTQPGEYTAALTVTDATGRSAVAAVTLGVTPAFAVSAEAVGPPAGGSVALNASGSGGVSPYAFYWAWGDGSGSTGASVRHTFVRSGTYEVQLRGIDGAGHLAAAWSNVTVLVPPGEAQVVAPVPGIPLELAAFAGIAATLGALGGVGMVLVRRRRRANRRRVLGRGGRAPPAPARRGPGEGDHGP